MPVPFTAYHGLTSAQHQAKFNTLANSGYRMISLSVYGSTSSPRYAAVWTKEFGPAWVATHGVDATGYQNFFNTWNSKGYIPKIISATGAGSAAVFATVFEKVSFPAVIARHGLSKAQFEAQNDDARKKNLILYTCAAYGSSSTRLYAAVWVSNIGNTKWLVYSDLSASDYQKQFNACIQLPIYMPEFVSVFEDNRYCAMFTDRIRGTFVAKHNIGPTSYQTAFDEQVAAGRIPFTLDAGGVGTGAKFGVVFAETHLPKPRTWRTNGPGTTVTNGLDTIFKNFMQKHGVRYAQFCVSKAGIVKHNKAYTWAESNYKTADNSDMFLLASCSKLFVCAAIQELFNRKTNPLLPGDKAYKILGFSNPKDSRSDAITIQNLIDNKGGFDAKGYDCTYDMRNVATTLGLNRAVTKTELASYMYKNKSLLDDPGLKYNYCNYGFVLLTLIVEKVSGQGYFSYLKSAVLDKVGATEVKVWPTVANPRPTNEVATESAGLGLSAIKVTSTDQVPKVYGGDGMVKEVAAGSCGMASSALGMVQTIRSYAVWGNGGRANGSARTGSTPGSSTRAESNADNIDWAYTINTRDFLKYTEDGQPLKDLDAAIQKFLSDNKAGI